METGLELGLFSLEKKRLCGDLRTLPGFEEICTEAREELE